jgi:arsenite methyltransferase
MTDYLDDTFEWSDPRLVDAYDDLPLWSASFGLLLLKHIRLERGMSMLDIGCGTGFPLLELAQRLGPSCRAVGIDPWREALQRAGRKASAFRIQGVTVAQGDGASLPFGSNWFHLVVSNLGLNNFSAPERVLSECWRVLQAGGQVVFTTNLRGHMRELYGVMAGVLKEFGRPEWLEQLQAHIDHRVTVESARRMLGEVGFTVSRVFYEEFPMRFTDGSALLRHAFIKAGFLGGWREVIGLQEEQEVFTRLETRLNETSARKGELVLTIPMAYLEGVK